MVGLRRTVWRFSWDPFWFIYGETKMQLAILGGVHSVEQFSTCGRLSNDDFARRIASTPNLALRQQWAFCAVVNDLYIYIYICMCVFVCLFRGNAFGVFSRSTPGVIILGGPRKETRETSLAHAHMCPFWIVLSQSFILTSDRSDFPC